MIKLKTLRAKFVCSALVIVIAVTLAICWLIYFVVGGMLNQSVFDRVASSTEKSAQQIDGWFSEQSAIVEQMYHVMHGLPDDTSRRAVISQLYAISIPYIGFTAGGVLCGCGWVAPGNWPIGRDWFEATMANRGEITFAPPYVDMDTGELIITVAQYIGQLEGRGAVFAINLPMTDVMDMVWDSVTIPGSYAILTDQDGNILNSQLFRH